MLPVDIPPDSVIRAEYTSPALDDCPKKTMHANMFVKISPTHGTPALLARPMNLGAFPFLDMKRRMRDATYRELLPAEITLITIKELMRCAAGRMPASVKAIVKGELAVFESALNNDLSLYGMRIPMKKMVPVDLLGRFENNLVCSTHQYRRPEYAKTLVV